MKARDLDRAAGATEQAEVYYTEHPGSPSAVRRPKLFVRSGNWIALLGRNIQDGVAGFGPTVEAALRAFDVQYRAAFRAPGTQFMPSLRAPVQASFHRVA